jgi:hypothetical protein
MCASNEACGTSGTCVSTSGLNPKQNGGTCVLGTDCLSGNCNTSNATNIICQGDADAGGACDIAADCGGATPGCAMHQCQ